MLQSNGTRQFMCGKTIATIATVVSGVLVALILSACAVSAVTNRFVCTSDASLASDSPHCVVHDYEFTCPNGVAVDDSATLDTDGDIKCSSCIEGYAITDQHQCDPVLFFFQQPVQDGTSSANAATFRIAASDDAKLWWVVYSGGTVIPNSTLLITNASGTGGARQSGKDGIDITAQTPYSFTVNQLQAETNYVLYAAIQKDATNESILSMSREFSTTKSGFISFTSSPATTTVTHTTANITLTADENANLYWVVYDSAQSGLTTTKLIEDATSSGGVRRSGSGKTVDAFDPKTIKIMLGANQTYHFYAVVEDSDLNQALSSELPFTTPGYPYVCNNGTKQSGTTNAENVTYCIACDDYYKIDSNNSCIKTTYSCTGGTAATDNPAASEYGATDDKNADIEKCTSCDSATDIIINGACQALEFTNLAIVDGTETANSATLSVTASHAATLHWVVYASGTTKSSATTVVNDAADGSTVGLDRSGTSGVALTATTTTQITDIDGLSATTPYTLYAVITAQGTSVLSSAINFATTAAGVPSFTVAPVASGETQTTANIAFTSDKAASLYWIVYESAQTLSPAQFKSDATGTGGVDRSGATPDTVSASISKSITVGNDPNPLSALKTYHFYALLEDTDGNQRVSNVLTFNTVGYPFVCNNGTFQDGVSTTANMDSCKACDPGYGFEYGMMGDSCKVDSDGDNTADVSDIDDDNDGLIEIDTIEQLYNMRYDLEGESYDDEADDGTGNEGDTTGAPTATNKATSYVCGASATGTCGYELTANLSFDIDGQSDGTWSVSGGSYSLDSGDDSDYFDASSGGWEPIGDSTNPFDAFFEGNNYTITGLAVQRSDTAIGLFGHIASNSTIQNLTLTNSLADSTGSSNTSIGLLAGTIGDSGTTTPIITIDNVDITGTSRSVGNSGGNRIGGLAGQAQNVNITNSSSAALVDGHHGSDYTGGLVGGLYSGGTIDSSHATGAVYGDNSSASVSGTTDRSGGLAGELTGGTISNSYATGAVYGKAGTGSRIGGLLGLLTSGTISTSYATGNVTGSSATENIGGLVGEQNGGTISASYAADGTVRSDTGSDNIGGLVGRQSGGTIHASHAVDSTVDATGSSGTNEIGGLVGEKNNNSSNILASYANVTIKYDTRNSNNVGGLVGYHTGSGRIVASYAIANIVSEGSGNSIIRAGGLVGRHDSGSIIASYATGSIDRSSIALSSFTPSVIGGLIGRRSGGSMQSSYATVNIDGGNKSRAGRTVGEAVGGSSSASYGFGSHSNVITSNTNVIHSIPASGVTTPSNATGLTGSSYFSSTEASHAWSFASGEAPKLKYADYDAGGSTYSCSDVTVSYKGTDYALSCTDNTLLPWQ